MRDEPLLSDIPLMSVKDVATKLSVTRNYVFALIKSHELPALKLGGMYRVRQEDLRFYLDSCIFGN